MKAVLPQLVVLCIALPLQLALVPINAHTRWLTPGELRFWTVSIYICVEIGYLILF
jgi:hypothetical protein